MVSLAASIQKALPLSNLSTPHAPPMRCIALRTMASPIPSAPVALAAGAAYGHVWGTVQVVIGAELGALIAFGLARVLGPRLRRRTPEPAATRVR